MGGYSTGLSESLACNLHSFVRQLVILPSACQETHNRFIVPVNKLFKSSQTHYCLMQREQEPHAGPPPPHLKAHQQPADPRLEAPTALPPHRFVGPPHFYSDPSAALVPLRTVSSCHGRHVGFGVWAVELNRHLRFGGLEGPHKLLRWVHSRKCYWVGGRKRLEKHACLQLCNNIKSEACMQHIIKSQFFFFFFPQRKYRLARTRQTRHRGDYLFEKNIHLYI